MIGATLWRMALRNLRRNLRRSLLTVGAIAFGLSCLIVFVALKEGLHQEMVTSTIRLDVGSFQVHAAGYRPNRLGFMPLSDPIGVRTRLDALGLATAARLKVPALLIGPSGSATVLLSGVDAEIERGQTIIAERLEEGGYLPSAESLLIGADLAENLGVGVSMELTLMVRNLLGQPVSKRYQVGGIFRTDLASFNRSQIFLPINQVQALVGGQGLVSELAVMTASGDEQRRAAEVAGLLDPARYRVDSWQAIAADVGQLIELNDGTMNLLMLIIFFIVALGIANTMTMTVYERYREFGILAAIGLRPSAIVRLVASEALLLGFCGALLGSLVGGAACLYLGHYGIDLTALTSSNQYFATSHVLHAVLRPRDLLLANLVTLTTGLLAGLYPAWRASKLDPVEALRHA